MIDSPNWSEEELDQARKRAIEFFREQRLAESLEEYLKAFDSCKEVVQELLDITVNLTDFADTALPVLTSPKLQEAFRYLPGPPISTDDLKVVADSLLTAGRLRGNREMVLRVVKVILTGLDSRRFPWVAEKRPATETELRAAVLASAALMAMRRVETSRRSGEKKRQEERVEAALIAGGLTKVPTRVVETGTEAPAAGEFCRESKLGSRKADFIVGLWDHRIMPIECKVSNSFLNSIKRLNNDAAVKAVVWRQDFGERRVVPAAVLSGVYNLRNLIEAQSRGLTLFWAHDLQSLIDWIETSRR